MVEKYSDPLLSRCLKTHRRGIGEQHLSLTLQQQPSAKLRDWKKSFRTKQTMPSGLGALKAKRGVVGQAGSHETGVCLLGASKLHGAL